MYHLLVGHFYMYSDAMGSTSAPSCLTEKQHPYERGNKWNITGHGLMDG